MTRTIVCSLSVLLLLLAAGCATAPGDQPAPAAPAPAEAPVPQAVEAALDYPNKPHHREADLSCADCHGVDRPDEAAPVSACLDCHGTYEDLAAATFAGEHQPNPHESPHYGNDQDCGLCHFEHEESENMCGDCHEWATAVP